MFWFVMNSLLKIPKRKIKGYIGEMKVNNLFSSLPSEYRLYSDVMLRKPNGLTTQIDHIVVSPYGVYVVETKNYSGIIVGGLWDNKWKSFVGFEENDFYNPVRQNYGHLCTASELLHIKKYHMYNIVSFGNNANLQIEGETNEKSPVVVSNRNLRNEVLKRKNRVFSDAEVERICKAIEESRMEGTFQEKRTHIKNVKRYAR